MGTAQKRHWRVWTACAGERRAFLGQVGVAAYSGAFPKPHGDRAGAVSQNPVSGPLGNTTQLSSAKAGLHSPGQKVGHSARIFISLEGSTILICAHNERRNTIQSLLDGARVQNFFRSKG